MSLTRTTAAATTAIVLLLASGCGARTADPDEGALGSTGEPTPATTTAPADPTPTVSRTAKPHTPAASASPTNGDGDGDGEGDEAPVTAGGGVCGRLTATQVGEVIGAGVRGAGLPGGGCEFDHADRRLPQATVKDTRYAGMDAAKTEATSSVEGEPEDLSGIGTAAFVVTGTSFGGTQVQGAGAVHVGSRTIAVWLAQEKGLSAADVRDLVVRMLRLVATAAR